MSQLITTKYYGDLHFERTWAASGGIHIGRLLGGSYAHIGGLPVTDKADLIACIPQGEALTTALDWFENRHKRAEEALLMPPKLVMFYTPDRSWRYVESNTPVERVEDLYEALKGSDALEGAVKWFVTRQQAPAEGASSTGLGLDDRITQILVQKAMEGATREALASQLKMPLTKDLYDLLKSMENDGLIARKDKTYYLPNYAPAGIGALVRGGDEER